MLFVFVLCLSSKDPVVYLQLSYTAIILQKLTWYQSSSRRGHCRKLGFDLLRPSLISLAEKETSKLCSREAHLLVKENPNSKKFHFLANSVAAKIRVSSFVLIKPLPWLNFTSPQLTLIRHTICEVSFFKYKISFLT